MALARTAQRGVRAWRLPACAVTHTIDAAAQQQAVDGPAEDGAQLPPLSLDGVVRLGSGLRASSIGARAARPHMSISDQSTPGCAGVLARTLHVPPAQGWPPFRAGWQRSFAVSGGTNDGSSGAEPETVSNYRALVPVRPELEGELRRLAELCGADAIKLAREVAKLPVTRQQGMVEHGSSVAAHLLELGVELPQLGQLVLRCPGLFSWAVEQRAGVLCGQLMELGLSASAAARCFQRQPGAAATRSFEPGIAVLAGLFGGGDSERGKQRLGQWLDKQPTAVQLLRYGRAAMQQRIDFLLEVVFSSKEELVKRLWHDWNFLGKSTARLVRLEAVLQQELRLDPSAAHELWLKALRSQRRVVTRSTETLERNVRALVQEFGLERARMMICTTQHLLSIPSVAWQRALAVMRLHGVADPAALAIRNPYVIALEWLGTNRTVNLLAMRQSLPGSWTDADVIERFAGYISTVSPQRAVGRLLYLQQRGLLRLLVPNKRDAAREWRRQHSLPVGRRAAGEPPFVGVSDVCLLPDTKFPSLAAFASQQPQRDGQLSSDAAAAGAATATDCAEFVASLELQPAWRQLLAQAEAKVEWLRGRLPPELLRAVGEAAPETAAVA